MEGGVEGVTFQNLSGRGVLVEIVGIGEEEALQTVGIAPLHTLQEPVFIQFSAGGIGGNIDGTLEVCGAKFTFTQAFHSTKHGSPVGFVIEMPGGHTVYHAGDTGLFGDMALIADRFDIDLAFLPAGGVFTMDGPLAARAASLLGAKAAMPIHYATFPVLAPNADAFVQALAEKAPDCRPFVMEPNSSAMLD